MAKVVLTDLIGEKLLCTSTCKIDESSDIVALTEGKTYEVVYADDKNLCIVCDTGQDFWFPQIQVDKSLARLDGSLIDWLY